MKNTINISFVILAGLFIFSSCSKTKVNSNRLMKAGTWKVTEMSVNGDSKDQLPSWEISDCDIYEELCTGKWMHPDDEESAEFIWQFRDKGEVFEIAYQGEGDLSQSGESATEAYELSGVYEVMERKKDQMEFKSSSTIGYDGQEVLIRIENNN